MVTLDFRIDQQILDEDMSADPVTADAAALQETFFVMPVRLRVAGVELLERPAARRQSVWVAPQHGPTVADVGEPQGPSPWLPVPWLHVATIGRDRLNEARQVGASRYPLPGSGWSLHLEKGTNDSVRIVSGVNGRAAAAPFEELAGAFDRFATRVRQTLRAAVPALQQHAYWGPWFTPAAS